jgi:hypothetical protein
MEGRRSWKKFGSGRRRELQSRGGAMGAYHESVTDIKTESPLRSTDWARRVTGTELHSPWIRYVLVASREVEDSSSVCLPNIATLRCRPRGILPDASEGHDLPCEPSGQLVCQAEYHLVQPRGQTRSPISQSVELTLMRALGTGRPEGIDRPNDDQCSWIRSQGEVRVRCHHLVCV